ncbi:MAG: FadR family transcriptional regulator [Chloroflexi bacterium]|nr:FadR family transcriptional regulator [Chloroflexota bacterium]
MTTIVKTDVEALQFRKIKDNERLFQKVVDEVGTKIIEGVLKPGDMLPPERIIAEQFGVSRTVIREAIKALELQGLVEVQHGRGAMVVRPSADSVSDSVVRFVRTQNSPLWALLELRCILEVEIAGLAAERCTEEDIRNLTELWEQMATKVDSPSEYVELDLEFHRALCKAAHNQLFPLVLEPVMMLARESRRVGATAPNAPKRSIGVHKRILEAVKRRDSNEAQRTMREHLSQVAGFIAEAESRDADTRSGDSPVRICPAGDTERKS